MNINNAHNNIDDYIDSDDYSVRTITYRGRCSILHLFSVSIILKYMYGKHIFVI